LGEKGIGLSGKKTKVRPFSLVQLYSRIGSRGGIRKKTQIRRENFKVFTGQD
jgi:hypothetical protein